MLDIAHPLVQRLIEAVKETALTDEDRYGRTATLGTAEVDQPTAVYTALVRYVAQTEPESTIMEELVRVGLPVYGSGSLSQEQVESIGQSEPKPVQPSSHEKQIDLENAIEHDDLDAALDATAEQHRDIIIEERTEMRENIDTSESSWTTGIDEVDIASIDLLTVTIYYPSENR